MKNIFVIIFDSCSDKVDDFCFESKEEAEKYLKDMQDESAKAKYHEAHVEGLNLYKNYKEFLRYTEYEE